MNTLAYFTSELSPEIFTLWGFTTRWYSLLFIMTFFCGFVLMKYFFLKEKQNHEDVDILSLYVFLGTLIGARLGHCLFYSPLHYLANPTEILQVWKGGLASHGGAIGILTAMWLYSKRNKKYPFIWIADRVVITVALGGLFIRIGNFFNSEIIGKPTDLPWAVIFTRIDNIPRHPAQLYEAIIYFCIFLLLLWIYKHKILPNTQQYLGLLFGLFMILVFTARFGIEFLKEVQVSFESNMFLDMGQLLSIPFIVAGIIITKKALNNEFLPKKNKHKQKHKS